MERGFIWIGFVYDDEGASETSRPVGQRMTVGALRRKNFARYLMSLSLWLSPMIFASSIAVCLASTLLAAKADRGAIKTKDDSHQNALSVHRVLHGAAVRHLFFF